jgi:hypothetical protein
MAISTPQSQALVACFVLGDDIGRNAAARREAGRHFHPARLTDAAQVIQYIIGQGLVKDAFVPIALQVEFQALELDATAVGAVLDGDLAEVRLPCPRADAGEFRTADGNGVVAPRARVVKDLKFLTFGHTHTQFPVAAAILQAVRGFTIYYFIFTIGDGESQIVNRKWQMGNVAEKKAVVLLSGGLDSATTLAIARREGFASFGSSRSTCGPLAAPR